MDGPSDRIPSTRYHDQDEHWWQLKSFTYKPEEGESDHHNERVRFTICYAEFYLRQAHEFQK